MRNIEDIKDPEFLLDLLNSIDLRLKTLENIKLNDCTRLDGKERYCKAYKNNGKCIAEKPCIPAI